MLKKLSLAALIAMGSMSVASAATLTEAIKGVDLSGMIRVRFYNESDNALKDANKKVITNGYTRWRTSSDFKFTIPVSKELKLVYKLGVEGNVYGQSVAASNENVDPNPAENLVFFKYSNNGLNVIAGKIPVGTPVTGSGHGEAHGAGLIASYKVNNNLVVAAAATDTVKGLDQLPNKVTAKNITAFAVMYKEDVLAVNAWFLNVKDTIDSDIVISADYKINGIGLHADYATASLTDTAEKTFGVSGTQTYLNVSAAYAKDQLSAKIGYAQTGSDGGVVVLDADAPIVAVAPVGQLYNIADSTDTSLVYGKLGYKVDAKTSAYVAAATSNDSNDNTSTDITVGVKYKYAKKLGVHAYYSMLSVDNGTDNNELRVEALYKF